MVAVLAVARLQQPALAPAKLRRSGRAAAAWRHGYRSSTRCTAASTSSWSGAGQCLGSSWEGPPAARSCLSGNTSRPSDGQYSSGGVPIRTHVFRGDGDSSPPWLLLPLISSWILDCIAFASSSALNLPPPVTVSVRHGLVENLADASWFVHFVVLLLRGRIYVVVVCVLCVLVGVRT